MNNLKKFTTIEIKNSGHWPYSTKDDGVNKKLNKFFEELCPDTSSGTRLITYFKEKNKYTFYYESTEKLKDYFNKDNAISLLIDCIVKYYTQIPTNKQIASICSNLCTLSHPSKKMELEQLFAELNQHRNYDVWFNASDCLTELSRLISYFPSKYSRTLDSMFKMDCELVFTDFLGTVVFFHQLQNSSMYAYIINTCNGKKVTNKAIQDYLDNELSNYVPTRTDPLVCSNFFFHQKENEKSISPKIMCLIDKMYEDCCPKKNNSYNFSILSTTYSSYFNNEDIRQYFFHQMNFLCGYWKELLDTIQKYLIQQYFLQECADLYDAQNPKSVYASKPTAENTGTYHSLLTQRQFCKYLEDIIPSIKKQCYDNLSSSIYIDSINKYRCIHSV